MLFVTTSRDYCFLVPYTPLSFTIVASVCLDVWCMKHAETATSYLICFRSSLLQCIDITLVQFSFGLTVRRNKKGKLTAKERDRCKRMKARMIGVKRAGVAR